jgi:hypothetical protein
VVLALFPVIGDNDMSNRGDLKCALQSVDPDRFVATAKRIVGDHHFSEHDFDRKYARLRRDYPAYDALCRSIQAEGPGIREDAMLHAAGMELLFRTLITIAEEDAGQERKENT